MVSRLDCGWSAKIKFWHGGCPRIDDNESWVKHSKIRQTLGNGCELLLVGLRARDTPEIGPLSFPGSSGP
jgi:hypothetical protein